VARLTNQFAVAQSAKLLQTHANRAHCETQTITRTYVAWEVIQKSMALRQVTELMIFMKF
jgi:hypothetical protein